MADRILTWFLATPLVVGAGQRESYELDDDYRPSRVWLRASRAPTGSNIVIDINYQETPVDTAVSIFTTPNPGIQRDSLTGERDYFTEPRLVKKGGLITLDVDAIGSGEGGENVTVQLELEKT